MISENSFHYILVIVCAKWKIGRLKQPMIAELDRNELARILRDNHSSYKILQDSLHFFARSCKITIFCKNLGRSCKITIWSWLGVISIYTIKQARVFCSYVEKALVTQVEVARPKWPLIRRVSSAHMFPVRSNYMVWKRLRSNFCLDNVLELAWSEATLFWDGLIRGSFKRTEVWSEADSSAH